ncbi:hypothetical protein [Lewinella cohaerens]|uniref:hypothetical protein n=1 Tax=Lewinella cohaerens TaxID=70995 RepID=UPI0003A4289A|nr:hypothetical protein [Lewinella cohaerens]
MRLLLLACLLPWVLTAQQESSYPSSQNFLQRNNIQVGFFAQRDNSSPQTYTYSVGGIIPLLQRKGLFGIAVSSKPFKKLSFLELQLNFGYERIDHTGDNLDFGRNWFGENFTEQISYDHWQLATGFQLEVMHAYRCSPFIGARYLLVFPEHLRYVAQRDFDPDVDLPVYMELNGGGKLSQGWEINTGLRLYITQHWNLKLGIYYSLLTIKMDWPSLSIGRFSDNNLFATDNIGFMLSTQYRW